MRSNIHLAVELPQLVAEVLPQRQLLIIGFFVDLLAFQTLAQCLLNECLEFEEDLECFVVLLERGEYFAVLQLDFEGGDVVEAVAFAGDPDAVLHFGDELVSVLLLVEVEGVGEVDDPSVGVVAGKPGEDLCCPVVVLEGVLRVVQSPHVLVEVSVGNCVGDVVLPYLFTPDLDRPLYVLLEGQRFSQADQYLSLFLVDGGQDGAGVHVFHFDLGDLLDDVEFLERQVVLELLVEDLHLLQTDVHVVGVVQKQVVVLLVVHLYQAGLQDLIGPFDVPKALLQLTLRQADLSKQQVALRPFSVAVGKLNLCGFFCYFL